MHRSAALLMLTLMLGPLRPELLRSELRWPGPLAPAGWTVRQATSPRATELTVDRLKSLRSTSNDPTGDSFIGTYDELTRLLDAIRADASLVSPMYLFLASKTALMLNRLEDAAVFFYGAQLRAAFDFERYDVPRRADGSNAATYLAFLRQTIGMLVNPAIMREPPAFAAVVERLEGWNVVPAATAYYPEFAGTTGDRLPPDRWPAAAARIKDSFMTEFARRQVRLLNDADYFKAFRVVQAMNLGDTADTPENRARYREALDAMERAEARLFPSTGGAPAAGAATSAPPAAGAAASTPPGTDIPPAGRGAATALPPRRIGPGVPEPKLLRRVEPVFPAGATGAIILEVTVGVDGRVTGVRVLRQAAELETAAIAAVRQWQYELPRVDGRPHPVIVTVTFSPRIAPGSPHMMES